MSIPLSVSSANMAGLQNLAVSKKMKVNDRPDPPKQEAQKVALHLRSAHQLSQCSGRTTFQNLDNGKGSFITGCF